MTDSAFTARSETLPFYGVGKRKEFVEDSQKEFAENQLYIQKLMTEFGDDLSTIIPEAQTLAGESISDLMSSIANSDIAQLGKDLFSPAKEVMQRNAAKEVKEAKTEAIDAIPPLSTGKVMGNQATPQQLVASNLKPADSAVPIPKSKQLGGAEGDLLSMYQKLMGSDREPTQGKMENISDLVGKWANILNRSSLEYKGGTGAAIGQGVAGYKKEQDLLASRAVKGKEAQVNKFMDLYTKQKELDVDRNKNLPETAKMIEYLKKQVPGLKYSDYVELAKKIGADGGSENVKQFMSAYKMTDEYGSPEERATQARNILNQAEGSSSVVGSDRNIIKKFNPDTGVIE